MPTLAELVPILDHCEKHEREQPPKRKLPLRMSFGADMVQTAPAPNLSVDDLDVDVRSCDQNARVARIPGAPGPMPLKIAEPGF